MHLRLMLVVGVVLVSLAGCSSRDAASASPASPRFSTCRDAFAGWVAGAASLNSPGTDLVATLADQERVQRRVFESCGLDEAERLNQELQVEYAPGIRRPLIEPDMRTFADVECVDEAPLFDGTRLCAEVGH